MFRWVRHTNENSANQDLFFTRGRRPRLRKDLKLLKQLCTNCAVLKCSTILCRTFRLLSKIQVIIKTSRRRVVSVFPLTHQCINNTHSWFVDPICEVLPWVKTYRMTNLCVLCRRCIICTPYFWRTQPAVYMGILWGTGFSLQRETW